MVTPFHTSLKSYIHNIWFQVFKNGPNTIYGRQPLKNFEGIWSALVDYIPSSFLKAVFHDLYLVHSWILCPIWTIISINSFMTEVPIIYKSTVMVIPCKKLLTSHRNGFLNFASMTHFMPWVSFYTPRKNQKTRFFDTFRRYKKRPVTWNWLNIILDIKLGRKLPLILKLKLNSFN